MDDPIEARLRELLREPGTQDNLTRDTDNRLERVLHKAHVQGGVLDLLNLFTRWGWVLSEGVSRGMRHREPQRRREPADHPHDSH